MIGWRVVPIQRWPGEQTRSRKHDRFGARGRGVNWSATTDLLARELRHLGARSVVLQMAVTDAEVRNDGWIRANATPAHPGVILTFESRHGPLSYPCDTFRDWQANVRAIALALEALRTVDRYGVTRRGEQYTGWKQLPPGGGSTPTMTVEVAAEVLAFEAGHDEAGELLRDPELARWCFREAAKGTHPDVEGGSVEAFQRVHAAKQVLDRYHGN